MLYKIYLNLIKNSTLSDKVIIPFSEKASKKFSYHLFPLILKKKNNKKIFLKMLKKKFNLNMHYFTIHNFSYYKSKEKIDKH